MYIFPNANGEQLRIEIVMSKVQSCWSGQTPSLEKLSKMIAQPVPGGTLLFELAVIIVEAAHSGGVVSMCALKKEKSGNVRSSDRVFIFPK